MHFLFFFIQVLYEQQLDFDWEDLLCLLWLPIVLKRLAMPMPRRPSSLTFSCPLSSFRVQFVGADYCLDKLQFFRDIVVGSKPLRVVAFRHQHQHCREVFANMVTWKCSFVMRIPLPISFTLSLAVFWNRYMEAMRESMHYNDWCKFLIRFLEDFKIVCMYPYWCYAPAFTIQLTSAKRKIASLICQSAVLHLGPRQDSDYTRPKLLNLSRRLSILITKMW